MADTEKNILINIDLETGQVNSQLDEIDGKIKDLGKGANPDSFRSIKTQIREAREEATALAIAIADAEEAGQNVDKLQERYTQVTTRAAQLKDAVEDVNSSIANANPDNRLQGLVSIAQGAVIAIQGVASAFTLVGVDAETAQVAIAKLQALIALTDAISSIDKIKRGFTDLTQLINLSSVAQRANNVATAAAVAVQRLFTGSVVATGTAFRALRVAIASTGIGLLVVALGSLISVLSEWISTSSKAEQAAERQKEAIERLTQAYEDETRQIDANNRKKILQLRLQGASEAKIREEQYRDALKKRDEALKQELALERNGATAQQLQQARQQRLQAQDDAETVFLQNQLADQEEQRKKLNEVDKGRTADAKTQLDTRADNEKNAVREINDFLQTERENQFRIRAGDAAAEIAQVNKKYDEIIKLARKYGKDTEELEKLRQSAISSIQQRAERAARELEVESSLELLGKRITNIGREINKELAGVTTETPRELIEQTVKKREDEIRKLFQLGATLRLEQLNLQREAREEAAKTAFEGIGLTPDEIKRRRDQLLDVIKQDFEEQKKVINDEIQKSEESLRKGLQITLLSIDVAAAEKNVANVQELLNRILVPFRKFGEGIPEEGAVSRFFRRAFTSIDPDAEQQAIEAAQKELNRIKAIAEQNIKQVGLVRQAEELEARGRRQSAIANVEATITDATLKNQELLKIEEKYQKDLGLSRANFEFSEKILKDKLKKDELEIERKQTDDLLKIRQPLARFSTAQDRTFVGELLTGRRQKAAFDRLLDANQEYFDALTEQENARFAKEKQDREFQGLELESQERAHKERLIGIENDYQNSVQAINDAQLQSKLALYSEIGNALGNLSQLFKRGTAAQKVTAIAEIALNTAVGFVQGLDIAQKSSKAAGPGAAFAFPIFYASQIAAVLGAAARAKQVLSQVEGPQPANTPNPGTPSAINASLFNLPQQVQNVRVTGQPSQVVRAFITQEDLRTAQERQQFLNKLSQF